MTNFLCVNTELNKTFVINNKRKFITMAQDPVIFHSQVFAEKLYAPFFRRLSLPVQKCIKVVVKRKSISSCGDYGR